MYQVKVLYGHRYTFTAYQYARRVKLVDGLEYLKQIFYEYQPLTVKDIGIHQDTKL